MTAPDTWSRRALFFGDSFVAGVGDPLGLGWVGRVVAASFAQGVGMTAYNLGVRLNTSLDIAERWQAETHARLWPETQSRVVFSFGANETTAKGDATRMTPARSLEALRAMLRGSADLSLPCLVVGPPLAGDDQQHQRIRSLSSQLAAACEAEAAAFIEVAHRLPIDSTCVRQAREGDGSHPAAAGYQQLAELLIAAGILDWLTV